MRANEYYPGQSVRISASFSDIDNALTDPSTVTISVKSAAGDVTEYVYGTDEQLVKDETGLYHLDFTPDAAGDWYYRVESTGPVTAASEGHVVVLGSNF